MLTRRKFIAATIGSGLVAAAPFAASAEVVTDDIERTSISFQNSRVGSNFNGYKIGFLTDIHCGIFLSDSLLNKAVEIIKQSNVDLLLLGGDYIGIPDSYPAKLFSSSRNHGLIGEQSTPLVTKIFERLGQALQRIKPLDGIFAVLGNHDHWNNSKICMEVLQKYSVNFLVNQEKIIRRVDDQLRIFGCDDYWTGIPQLSKSFAAADKNQLRLMLSHNPDYVAECSEQMGDCFDLALAGHTHGGQVRISGLGPIAGYNIRHKKFGMGAVKIGNSLAYTSRGVGVVDIPYRINCKPEVLIVQLLGA